MIRVREHKRSTGKSGYSLKKLFALWLNMVFNSSALPLLISRKKRQQFTIRKAYEAVPPQE
jgi:hypothetical protein